MNMITVGLQHPKSPVRIGLCAVQIQINRELSPSRAYDLKGTKSLRFGNGDITSKQMKKVMTSRGLVAESFLVHLSFLIGLEVK